MPDRAALIFRLENAINGIVEIADANRDHLDKTDLLDFKTAISALVLIEKRQKAHERERKARESSRRANLHIVGPFPNSVDDDNLS